MYPETRPTSRTLATSGAAARTAASLPSARSRSNRSKVFFIT